MDTRPTTSGRDPRRCCGDDGAVIVEFALVLPFLVLLLFGVVDYGLAWRNDSILTSALRSGVRAGSQAQNASTADLLALQAFTGVIGQGKRLTIQKVVIYKVTAANTTGAVPPECLTAGALTAGGYTSSSVFCNVYSPSKLTGANLVAANFGGTTGKYDTFYPPTTRSNSLAGTGPDGFGMYAAVTYTSLTKIIPGTTMTLTDSSTGRLEPSAI